MIRQGGGFDLEALKKVFGSNQITLAQALVDKVEVTLDKSKARALCRVVPDEYEIVAEITFDAAGPDAGFGQLPVPGDLVLVGFANPDEAFIIRRMSSKIDTIPARAADGHLVAKALAGTKAFIESDTGVYLGTGGLTDPAQPLVLGNVLIAALTDLIAAFDDCLTSFDEALDKVATGPVGVGNLGSPVATDPALATALGLIQVDVAAIASELASVQSEYLDTSSTNIVAQKAFTERGS